MTLPGAPTGMARPGGAGHRSPGLERAPRRSVGELRLLFEARCAAVAAAAAAGEPRARGAKRRAGAQVPNGLPRAPPGPVIPRLTVTADEPDAPPASPGPPAPEPDSERAGLPGAGPSHLQQPRRLSTSSVSSTGSSLPEDSEDDLLLSDSESRSRGNVQLETGEEDAGQVREGPRRRSPGSPPTSRPGGPFCPSSGSPGRLRFSGRPGTGRDRGTRRLQGSPRELSGSSPRSSPTPAPATWPTPAVATVSPPGVGVWSAALRALRPSRRRLLPACYSPRIFRLWASSGWGPSLLLWVTAPPK